MKQAKIQEVRAYVIAANEMGADYHNQKGSHWIIDLPIANPMSVYEEYKAERTSWGINALGTVVVQVELTDGTIGIGCSIGGEPACYIIEKHLARFVEGQDPRNVELIWDQITLVTHYRAGGNIASTCYWPLEQLDRKVRPGAWKRDNPFD